MCFKFTVNGQGLGTPGWACRRSR